METFSALLANCAGNAPAPGEFPAQRPVTRSFDVFFDLRLNKRLSKQWWGWWFETLSSPLWRHCNVFLCIQACHVQWPSTLMNNSDSPLSWRSIPEGPSYEGWYGNHVSVQITKMRSLRKCKPYCRQYFQMSFLKLKSLYHDFVSNENASVWQNPIHFILTRETHKHITLLKCTSCLGRWYHFAREIRSLIIACKPQNCTQERWEGV